MDMRKLATLSIAVVATLAMAGSASAVTSVSIVGPNTPGTHVYSIVMSFDPGDGGGIRGLVSSLTTTGTYTGVFTDPVLASFPTNLGGPLTPPANGNTGITGSWGHTAGSAVASGTFTVGTAEITVAPGQTVQAYIGSLDGFVTNGFYTVAPSFIAPAITIIPEPTTAALLGLGIVGLVVAGRRSRA
jgi:hypothetical protein